MPADPSSATAHRPWPLPERPWIMSMRWEDLLFAHWPVPAAALEPHLPAGLALDRFEGVAWLGVVPFRMAGTHLRGLPPLPGTAGFPELNVRTYVVHQDRPGVWFFSLDAASRLAVRTARRFFHLPYFDARMTCRLEDGGVHYASRRTHRGAAPVEFRGSYRPTGPASPARAGSLEHWLAERYCLYAADGQRRLWRGEIHHRPWPLQPAEASLEVNTMAAPLGLDLRSPPASLLFARAIETVAWRLVPVTDGFPAS